MAAAGRVVVDTIALLGEHIQAGRDHGRARPPRSRLHRVAGRHLGVLGLPGLPGLDLHVPERHGRPRDSRLARARRGRHPLGRRRSDPRRLRGRLRLHVSRRRDLSRGTAPTRRLPGCAPGGIEQCRPGNRLSDISYAVQTATEEAGYSVVRSLVGHGIGRSMHEDRKSRTTARRAAAQTAPGMTFAVEPMITAGSAEGRRAR